MAAKAIVRAGVAYPPVLAAAKATLITSKYLQEGLKAYFILNIWSYKYCDKLQASELVIQAWNIYQNRLGFFKRDSLTDKALLAKDVAKEKKVKVTVHNTRRVGKRSVLNSDTFVLKEDIKLNALNFPKSSTTCCQIQEQSLKQVAMDQLKLLAVDYLIDLILDIVGEFNPKLERTLKKLVINARKIRELMILQQKVDTEEVAVR
jgi:hypothetical protein